MSYNLNNQEAKPASLTSSYQQFSPLLKDEGLNLTLSFFAIIANSILNLLAPIIIGYAIDKYLIHADYMGVIKISILLFGIYLLASLATYFQTIIMGGVSQRLLFTLRNTIFQKLQKLPIAFFNQNKAGDLISRINNDTDKLNQFFSQALMQFVGNLFMMIGTGIAIIIINPRLGLAALIPAALLFIFTKLISAWLKKINTQNLSATGSLTANIQESLNNFKVITVFNRQDYFKEQFRLANKNNYQAAFKSGVANNTLTPLYGLAANLALIIVIAYGTHLITINLMTIGVLISFLTYVNRFYDPLRHIASLWSSFQTALASSDRIYAILKLESDLEIINNSKNTENSALITFKDVNFHYPDGKEVLRNINLSLHTGKTYALVGPTGGGKTTTASLMARLYDPSAGTILLNGVDIRAFKPEDLSKKIGFILQEPFLFSGTVHENIIYGNTELVDIDTGKIATEDQLTQILKNKKLDSLISRFKDGLSTKINANGESISLGQRQLIAFLRAVLRTPDLLIMDEATANIDTVTEKLLEDVIDKLPKTTTKVIIAHRLNTIKNADEIFFVNGGQITQAGSFDHALEMLMEHKSAS